MALGQKELTLPPRKEIADESEQEREARLHDALLRHIEDAANEVGRERICYALQISEALLSKKLRGIEDKMPCFRILAFCLKHEQSGRLGRALASYANLVPFQRPELIDPATALSEVVAMALAGECGNAAKEKIFEIYARVKKGSQ